VEHETAVGYEHAKKANSWFSRNAGRAMHRMNQRAERHLDALPKADTRTCERFECIHHHAERATRIIETVIRIPTGTVAALLDEWVSYSSPSMR
jgi:hypothetical protein